MRNKVIYGDYEGCPVVMHNNIFCIETDSSFIAITPKTVSSWELSTEKRSTSAVSMIGRGFLGGLVLGPIGAGIGAYSALKGQAEKVIQIVFKDGKKTIITLSNDDFVKFNFYMS